MSEPTEWMAKSASDVVDLIREVGIYRLGTLEGCPCTSFEVRDVHVDVSCHKSSDHSVRVWSNHCDYSDENYKRVDAAFRPIADEVLRQVDAYYDAGGEYAASYAVRFCSWEDDHPSAKATGEA